ncbi:S1C family serine protease [Dictyobacter formicarum]|uniref:PDZ domain-containing protein n=1 Tax=Dictyobacter formicarum TaxID=2778368 RepID=A0ABQ3VJJ2_9CHLR|nr:trypsin-like peptidase domain-containing protein [Dictyobacter formicarum]GHO86382.1 hypothetical protein KSZ_43880 [Dictyobacter formicarum]
MSSSDQKPDPSESSNIPQQASDASSEKPVEQTEAHKAPRSYIPRFLKDTFKGGTIGDTSSAQQPPGYAPLEAESDIYRSNVTRRQPPATGKPPSQPSNNMSTENPPPGGPPANQPSPYAEPVYRSYYPPDEPPAAGPAAGATPGNVSSNVPPPFRPGQTGGGSPYAPTTSATSPPGQYAYQAQGVAPQGFAPPGITRYQRKKPSNMMMLIALPLIALLMGALGGWLATSAATHPAGAIFTTNQSTEQVAAKFRTSVVQINVETERGPSLGSGVIIDPRGYIVTNNHVVNNGMNYQVVLYDNTKLPATVAGTDPNDDLAIVKIDPPKHMSVAKIGDSSRLLVGQPVLAIGNPLGITQTVTSGIVSALGRNVTEGRDILILNAIQTDAAINPGNSGGALVNMQGDLVGIPTLAPIDPEFKTPASGVGFAIPSNRVKFIAPQLIESGHVTQSGRADMGINAISVDPDIAYQAQLPVNHGALIVNVRPDSAAAQAGLRRGDIIVEADNHPIEDTTMLQDILINKGPRQTVTLRIYRGDQQMVLNVKLGEQQFS